MKKFYLKTGISVRTLQKFCMTMFLGSLLFSLNVELGGQTCDNPSTLILSSGAGSSCGTNPLTVENNEFGGGAVSVTLSTNGYGVLDQNIIDTSPFSFTYTPAITDAGSTVIITVTANNPDQECDVLTFDYFLDVNNIPEAPVVSNNGPLCEGETLNLFTATETEGIYSWSGPNGFTSTLQNPSIENITAAASGTYMVTVTVNGCTSESASTEVTVNAVPEAPAATNNGPLCEGTTIELTAGDVPGGSYLWSGPNGFTSTLQNPTIENITAAATGTYMVTVTLDGCESEPGSTEVTVNAVPEAPAATNNGPLCEGTTLELTAADVPGESYLWTGPDGFTSTLQNPTIENVTVAASGTYLVTVTVNGCTSEPGSTEVTVNAVPEAPAATNNGPLCEGTTIELTAGDVPGGSYLWSGPDGFTSTLQNPTIENVTVAASGTYMVTVTLDGCESEPGSTEVTVNAVPEAPAATNNGPLCEGGTLELTVADVPGGSYLWSGPNGFTSTLQNPTIENITAAASGTYLVTVTVNGCASEPASTEVRVNAVPEAPAATNNGPLCEGATLELTVADVPGGSYLWTGPNGFTSTFQNPSIENVTIAASGTYMVTVTVNGCTSETGSTIVEINSMPSAITGSNYTMAGSTTILTSVSPGGSWSSTVPSVAEINSSSGEVRGIAPGLTEITYTLPTGCSVVMTFNVLPSDWIFDSESFVHRSLVTASVIIEATEAESGFLAAFAGNECRGIAESVYNSLYGNYIFELNCFSNTETGDVLVFRYFNPDENREFNLDRSVNFTAGASTGSASAPFRINTGTDYSLPLSAGWNWFSLNTSLDNMTPRFILSSQNTPGDYIKNQTVSSTYYEGLGWFGSLETLDPRELYKIRLQNNSIVRFSGTPVDAEATPLSVAPGWNWIGYPPRQSMPVNSALGSLSPADLDYIKDQSTSSTYYSEFGLWHGTMDDMEPGKGYMLRVANAGTLIYPDPENKGNQMVSGTGQAGEFNPHPFEFSGEVNARIIMEEIPKGSDKDTLYAYVDDELRGLIQPLQFYDGTYYFSLMIYSNIAEGEIVTFKYYNSENKKYYDCEETIIYKADMVIGNAIDPLILNVDITTSVHENIINDPGLRVYPNPSDSYLNIEYTLNESTDVRITVYDAFGRAVQTLIDKKQEPGTYLYEWNSDLPPEGMYFIKLENGKRQRIRKVILLK